MKNAFFLTLFISGLVPGFSQTIDVKPGASVQNLRIGDSYEKVNAIIGFGKLKKYSDYLAEELFDRNPNKTLECLLGFDHYIKFEYLIPLPIQYIFFKDDKVSQIVLTSFPEYYRPVSENVLIGQKTKFWDEKADLKSNFGTSNLVKTDDYRMLESHYYLDLGIAFDFREGMMRTIHLFAAPDTSVGNALLQKIE